MKAVVALFLITCSITFQLARFESTPDQRPVLRVGLYLPLSGAGLTSNGPEIYDGMMLLINKINNERIGPYAIKLLICDDQYILAVAKTCWKKFAIDDPVQIVLGGHTSFTVAAGDYFEQYGILNIQCCTGPDSVYTSTKRKWMFGIHRPSDDYPKGIIKSISSYVDQVKASQGRKKENIPDDRVAILYNDASSFTVSTMESAARYAKDLGLRPIVTSYNGTAYPSGRILPLLMNVKSQGIRWLLVMALDPDGLDAAHAIQDNKFELSVKWITVVPGAKYFLPSMGAKNAEFYIAPAQWDASLVSTDSVFKTNANYVDEFNRTVGYIPTYTVASGSAAVMALLTALQQLPSGQQPTADNLARTLRDIDIDTFFGRILFNRYQRNFGGQPVSVQWLDGSMLTVLPEDYQSRPLVLVPPSEQDRQCSASGLYSDTLQCLRDQAQKRLLISVAVPIGSFVILAVIVFLYWHYQMAPISRRLIGARKGTAATQKDLPYELRRRFEAIAVLGSGSFGVVIEAWQLSNGKRTIRRAVKVVHARHRSFEEKDVRRLNREAEILRTLDSPNVVQYLESGVSRRHDVYWFVLELLVGDALDEWLDTNGTLSEVDAVKVGLDVCVALKSLHKIGIIHRDIKPGNIMKLYNDRPVGETLVTQTSTGRSGLRSSPASRTFNADRVGETAPGKSGLRSSPASRTFNADHVGEQGGNKGGTAMTGSLEFVTVQSDASTIQAKPRVMATADYLESSYKLIDLGTAVAVNEDEDTQPSDTLKTVTEMAFAGTPSYASPENYCNATAVSFPSDVWSLAVTLFHLVSGKLPFPEQTVSALSVAIAGDLDMPPPDVRDCAPEEVRSNISTSFAAVIAKGMAKRIEDRYSSIDEFASDLHGCLVKRGEGLYSAFISYRVFSQKYHATLLYEVLNNTTTPAGHRVIVYLDVKRLVKGEDWEEGFSSGLMNSLVALPLLSAGVIDPMANLKGTAEDPEDNVAKELLIMQAIMNSDDDSIRKLESIFPILVGKPCPLNDSRYPCTGNFFADGSNNGMKRLANSPSPTLTTAVSNFLKRRRIAIDDGILTAPISTVVKDLFALQGAQLWNHGNLMEEDIPEDSELWHKVSTEPSDPPLDISQLRMLKAEFRALVPGIHEVIDRAHANSNVRRKLKDQIESRRKELMTKVLNRIQSETLADCFQAWKNSRGQDDLLLKKKMRALPDFGRAGSGASTIFDNISSTENITLDDINEELPEAVLVGGSGKVSAVADVEEGIFTRPNDEDMIVQQADTLDAERELARLREEQAALLRRSNEISARIAALNRQPHTAIYMQSPANTIFLTDTQKSAQN